MSFLRKVHFVALRLEGGVEDTWPKLGQRMVPMKKQQ